jgi:hypothetical protein
VEGCLETDAKGVDATRERVIAYALLVYVLGVLCDLCRRKRITQQRYTALFWEGA